MLYTFTVPKVSRLTQPNLKPTPIKIQHLKHIFSNSFKLFLNRLSHFKKIRDYKVGLIIIQWLYLSSQVMKWLKFSLMIIVL